MISRTGINKNSKITLVELQSTDGGKLDSERSLDMYSYFRLPARAIHYLGSVLKGQGFENIEYVNPQYHGRFSLEKWKRIFNSTDILMASSITRTAKQTMQLLDNYHQQNKEGVSFAGGFDPTARPEVYSRHASYVVRGEGERTIIECLGELVDDNRDLEGIKGVSFYRGSEYIESDKRELLTLDELSTLPPPDYDSETFNGVETAVLETSRGCPKDCSFCSVTDFYDRKYRRKRDNKSITDLASINGMGNKLFFTDDNFVGQPKKVIPLLERIAESKQGYRFGIAQVTVQSSRNPELLSSLKKAGVKYLCVGVESLNDDSLSDLNKGYTAEQNLEALRTFRDQGFWVHSMMIVGAEGDSPESLDYTVELLKNNSDSAQFFSIIPLPGTKMTKRLEKQERLLVTPEDMKEYLYDGDHVLHIPGNGFDNDPWKLQQHIYKMYGEFYSPWQGIKRMMREGHRKTAFNLFAYTTFLGGKVLHSQQSQEHDMFLKEWVKNN